MILRVILYIIICCLIYSIFFILFSFLYKKIEKIDNEFYKKKKEQYSEPKKHSTYYNQDNSYNDYHQTKQKEYIPPKKEEKDTLPECFKTLGFTKKPASVDELKTRYKKLAKIYHPDMGGTEEEFQNIEKAYKEALLFYK